MNKSMVCIATGVLMLLGSIAHATQDPVGTSQPGMLKPFCLAAKQKGDFALSVSRVRTLLHEGRFRVLGDYSPYADAHVFAVTDDELIRTASGTTYGALGAVFRVGIAKVGDEIQVMYNNPNYIGVAYRMGSTLDQFKSKLARTLGHMRDYGGEGIPREELPEYNYAFGLESFGDFYEFAKYKTHEEAVRQVEKGLASQFKGIKKVYRLDIPGKKQTVFGIGMNSDVQDVEFLNDQHFMSIADYKELKRLPHLPYEILVHDNKVIGLHAHYRLAISFPDLPMVGKHAFGKMMMLPHHYEEYLTRLVGGQWPPNYDY